MRFLWRGLTGAALAVLTFGLLALAAVTLMRALDAGGARDAARPAAAERVFAVEVAVLQAETLRPVLTAYGDVRSARQLELRAATGGRIETLAQGFRDGGGVAAGETLYALDPADARAALALADSDLDAARAEIAEAQAAVTLAEAERAANARQRDLRISALARTRSLRERGNGTEADLEDAELALATAEQALLGRQGALAEAEARVARARIAETRAAVERDEAARRLADTSATAPFAGVLAEVAAVPGGLVAANERLGLLIDPVALEVAFRVSHAEFLRLIDDTGALLPLPVEAALPLEGGDAVFSGRIDRAGAALGAGETGRLVYAGLDADGRGVLRPGDFLTVRVREPALRDVAVVPATALGPDGDLLVLDPDARLETAAVTLLRRQGDAVILGDAPFGRRYVTGRAPQLGPGIRVRPVGETPDEAPDEAPDDAAADRVRLTPERRAVLIAAVRDEPDMAPAARDRLLTALEAETVPLALVERLERRTGG